MQLVTIRTPDGFHSGVVVGDEILDFIRSAEVVPGAELVARPLRHVLAGGDIALDVIRRVVDQVQGKGSLADQLRERGGLVKRDAATLAAPIPDPALILSCGTNYGGHMREMGAKLPSSPGAFIKANSAIAATGENIILPPSNPDWVDYEGEFCFIIGRPCHQVSEKEALDYIAGYTLANDVSARDWVLRMGKTDPADKTEGNVNSLYNIHGKNFPTFCPIGPTIVTKDDIPDPHATSYTVFLNGNQVQVGSTDDFIFSIPWMLAEFSKFYKFQPGDVVTTGSPSGVGLMQKPPRMLQHGDVIEVRHDKIGVLSNPVVKG